MNKNKDQGEPGVSRPRGCAGSVVSLDVPITAKVVTGKNCPEFWKTIRGFYDNGEGWTTLSSIEPVGNDDIRMVLYKPGEIDSPNVTHHRTE